MHSAANRIPYEACPLCSGQDAVQIHLADCQRHPLYQQGLPKAMRWVRCQDCRHVFTDSYFNDAALQLLFGTAHAGQTPGHDIAGGRLVSAKIVETVGALRSRLGGRWLDVGFGSGALLTTAEEFGYEAIGLDLRPHSVVMMRELGFEAHRVDISVYESAAPFDVISMADVLEHMPFPLPALRHAHRLLADEGLVFLSMPNLDCFLWKALDHKRQNPYWGEIEHYHNFGRQRLYELLQSCGFTPCRYSISERYVACMEIIARKTEVPS